MLPVPLKSSGSSGATSKHSICKLIEEATVGVEVGGKVGVGVWVNVRGGVKCRG